VYNRSQPAGLNPNEDVYNMNTITVNQDRLLSTIANVHGFTVIGLYDNGMTLKAAQTKKEKETLSERRASLACSLTALGIPSEVSTLGDGVVQVELTMV
jgi:hypothetical protein